MSAKSIRQPRLTAGWGALRWPARSPTRLRVWNSALFALVLRLTPDRATAPGPSMSNRGEIEPASTTRRSPCRIVALPTRRRRGSERPDQGARSWQRRSPQPPLAPGSRRVSASSRSQSSPSLPWRSSVSSSGARRVPSVTSPPTARRSAWATRFTAASLDRAALARCRRSTRPLDTGLAIRSMAVSPARAALAKCRRRPGRSLRARLSAPWRSRRPEPRRQRGLSSGGPRPATRRRPRCGRRFEMAEGRGRCRS